MEGNLKEYSSAYLRDVACSTVTEEDEGDEIERKHRKESVLQTRCSGKVR